MLVRYTSFCSRVATDVTNPYKLQYCRFFLLHHSYVTAVKDMADVGDSYFIADILAWRWLFDELMNDLYSTVAVALICSSIC